MTRDHCSAIITAFVLMIVVATMLFCITCGVIAFFIIHHFS
jgi:hypothetical protein